MIWEPAATFRALQTAGATRSFFTGWEQPGFQEDLIPIRLWSTKNSTGNTSSRPACPLTQPGWSCPSFLRWWSLLLPSNQASKENPPFALCGFTGRQQNHPSLEKVHPEVGRKVVFNSVLTIPCFFSPSEWSLKSSWNAEIWKNSPLSTREGHSPTPSPQQDPARCPE